LSRRQAYISLWQAIRSALSKANRDTKQARQSRNKDRRRIVGEARKLAVHLRDGWFDYPISHLVSGIGIGARWTAISEVLDALVAQASAEPDAWKTVQRNRLKEDGGSNYRSNLFLKSLHEHFQYWYERPLAHAIAVIASIALGEELGPEDVKRATRPKTRKVI